MHNLRIVMKRDRMTSPYETLTDLFGRRHDYLRISVTDRCNLRCRYCMPHEGIHLEPRARILTLEEIVRIARLFVQLGTHKIRITGGEPMVRQGIVHLLAELGRLPGLKELGMTTNGSLLNDRVSDVAKAGVTHINFSLDTFRPDRYFKITMRDRFADVVRAVRRSTIAGFEEVKINCVVMKGVNDDELNDFVAFTRDHAVSVRFIEYMPFSGNSWDAARLLPYQDMLEQIRASYDLEPCGRERSSDTAFNYRVPGHLGTIGFITPMTNHFCASCNRLRLTSDGNLKNCLFGDGEVDLKGPLRRGASDEDLIALIQASILRKKAHHGGSATYLTRSPENGRTMMEVGG